MTQRDRSRRYVVAVILVIVFSVETLADGLGEDFVGFGTNPAHEKLIVYMIQ